MVCAAGNSCSRSHRYVDCQRYRQFLQRTDPGLAQVPPIQTQYVNDQYAGTTPLQPRTFAPPPPQGPQGFQQQLQPFQPPPPQANIPFQQPAVIGFGASADQTTNMTEAQGTVRPCCILDETYVSFANTTGQTISLAECVKKHIFTLDQTGTKTTGGASYHRHGQNRAAAEYRG